MAFPPNHYNMSAILIFTLLITLSLDFTVAQIGVNYGREGDGLPPPAQVVALYKQYGIQRMRIYDTDPGVLQAVSGSNIELTVGILNWFLEGLAANQDNANTWVRDNILKYPNIRFRYIIVGNEVSPIRGDTAQYVPFVLRAMQNIYNAISAKNLGIKVTTAIDTEVLEPSQSWPPENGVFRSNVAPYLNPIVRFLMNTDAPLFASIYPYFAYMYNRDIDSRYALLDPSFEGVVTRNGVRYQNIFYALLDAVNAALEKSVASMASELGTDAIKPPPRVGGGESGWSTRGGGGGRAPQATNIPHVKGGSSGWPSPGGRGGRAPPATTMDDVSNIDNARRYINNLIQVVKKGTPKRPNEPIETYIFAMFDESRKPGDETEKHFGLFYPNGAPKYPVKFN